MQQQIRVLSNYNIYIIICLTIQNAEIKCTNCGANRKCSENLGDKGA